MERRPYLRPSFSPDYADRAPDVNAAAFAWDQRALAAIRAVAASHPDSVSALFCLWDVSAVDFAASMSAADAGIFVDQILRGTTNPAVDAECNFFADVAPPDLASLLAAADPGAPATVEVSVAAMQDDPDDAVETYRATHPDIPADWDLAPRRETEDHRNPDTIWIRVPYAALLTK